MWVVGQDGTKLVYCNMFKVETTMLKSKEAIYKGLCNHVAYAYLTGDRKMSVEREADTLYDAPDNKAYSIVGMVTLGNTETLATYSTEAAALKVIRDLSAAISSKQAFIFADDIKVVE